MKNLHKIFFVLISLVSLSSYCQQVRSFRTQPENKEALDSVINDVLSKSYYVDEKEELRVILTLKIDSLGEIHSAHIRRGKNLKQNYYYDICRKIENEVSAKFLYDEFKSDQGFQKYVFCDYSFSTNN